MLPGSAENEDRGEDFADYPTELLVYISEGDLELEMMTVSH